MAEGIASFFTTPVQKFQTGAGVELRRSLNLDPEMTPAQALYLAGTGATLGVTGPLGAAALGGFFGSGYAPGWPSGERTDPETGETIPATKIRDMFKKEHRVPSVRQHWKGGHKGIAALQAAGIALPAALAAYTRYTRSGIGGLRGTGDKAIADEVADEMRRTILKGGVAAGGLAAIGPKLWSMGEKVTRGAARVVPTALSKFKRMDFPGFTDTMRKLGGRSFLQTKAQGPSLLQSIHNRMRRLDITTGTPASEIAPTLQIHRAGQAERAAAELKALNLEGRYGIQAENMTMLGPGGPATMPRAHTVGGRSRFENLGTFKQVHTSGKGVGQLKVFEINGVPVVQDVKGALFIPNPEGVIQLQNFELGQFALRMGQTNRNVRSGLGRQPSLRQITDSTLDQWRQTGGITQQEKEIFKAWQNTSLAGRGDTGGNLVKVGEYMNPWERVPVTMRSSGISHNLEGVPVHRSGGHFKTSGLDPQKPYGRVPVFEEWLPRWDYLNKP